ncbi:MAG TPA: GTPase [Streptosporangiaceae bacterium]|jgi:GTP-binding protein EngB required for normal cell division
MTTTAYDTPEPRAHPDPAADRLRNRFEALRAITRLGAGYVDDDLMRDGRALLERYDARMRLSGEHTVVALIGGTGSGKSSLFNAIAGAELSAVGVTRPLTAAPHACVWGLQGAGPLLDWLGIDTRHRYARTNAPDTDRSLHGLVLLDLPDHDSVRAQETSEVNRLVGVADLLVFVLDPQKYADAALHWRFLTQMADHTSVSVLVLNQIDRLADGETEDCLTDLGRILDSEGVDPPRLLTTSAVTGAGVGELREMLSDTVERRRAATDRLTADLETLMRRFEPYARVPPSDGLDRIRVNALIDALTEAAGVSAVGDALTSAHELRSVDYVGWPFAKLVTRFRGDPLRRMRLGELRAELRAAFAGPVGAQKSEVDTAIRTATDGVADDLPEPWPAKVRDAAYRRSDELPDAIAAAMSEAVPNTDKVPGWWWWARIAQWLLVLAVIAGIAWIGALVVYGVLGVAHPPNPLLGDPGFLPYVALIIVGVLGLGWLLSTGCRNLVLAVADRRREEMEDEMRIQVAVVARERVVAEIEAEQHRYADFRNAYLTSAGH